MRDHWVYRLDLIHHSRTQYIDIHTVCACWHGLPRFVKSSVYTGKSWAGFSIQRKVVRFGRRAGREFQTDGAATALTKSLKSETERGPECSMIYLWRSLCTLYLHVCHVRVTVGDSGLCCCTCVTYSERKLTPLLAVSKEFKLRPGIFRTSRLRIGWCVQSESQGETGEYRRSDGMQRLLPWTRSGIPLAASAVHLTAVSCGLIYVHSGQAVLHSLQFHRHIK